MVIDTWLYNVGNKCLVITVNWWAWHKHVCTCRVDVQSFRTCNLHAVYDYTYMIVLLKLRTMYSR